MSSRRRPTSPSLPGADDDDVDLALRQVTRHRPDDLARALGHGSSAGPARWVETQLAQRQRRLDRLLEISTDTGPHWLHVEWQRSWSAAVPRRMVEYYLMTVMAALSEPVPRPTIESVLVLLGGHEAPWPPDYEVRTSRSAQRFCGMHYRIEPVYQKSVAELFAWGGLGVLFVPLARDADEPALKEATRWWKAHARDRQELAEAGAAMAVLGQADPRGRGLGALVVKLLDSRLVMQSSIYTMGKQQGLLEGKAEGKAEGEARGRARGKAEDVLAVLDARGLKVSAAARKRVLACTDVAQLDTWLRRAVVTSSVRALFDPPPA